MTTFLSTTGLIFAMVFVAVTLVGIFSKEINQTLDYKALCFVLSGVLTMIYLALLVIQPETGAYLVMFLLWGFNLILRTLLLLAHR